MGQPGDGLSAPQVPQRDHGRPAQHPGVPLKLRHQGGDGASIAQASQRLCRCSPQIGIRVVRQRIHQRDDCLPIAEPPERPGGFAPLARIGRLQIKQTLRELLTPHGLAFIFACSPPCHEPTQRDRRWSL